MTKIVRMVLRDMWKRKVRSLVIASGALWGVMVLVGLYTPIRAFEQESRNIMESLGSGTTFNIKGPPLKKLSPERIQEITQKVPDNWVLLPYVYQRMDIAVTQEGRDPVVDREHVAGVYPWKDPTLKLPASKGSWFSEEDVQKKRRVCVLGREVADEMGVAEVGGEIQIGGMAYRVVGILGTPPGFNRAEWRRFPGDIVFVPLSVFPVPLEESWSPGITLRVIVPNTNDLYAEMERAEKLFPNLNVTYSLAKRKYNQMKEHLSRWKRGLWVVIGICMLMGGFGFMILMLSSAKDRVKEVGIRRATGANRMHILVQFLTESALLSLIGGVFGIGAGAGVGYVANTMIGTPFMVDLGVWGTGLGISVLLGVVFGMYPAFVAANIDPVRAIRYE